MRPTREVSEYIDYHFTLPELVRTMYGLTFPKAPDGTDVVDQITVELLGFRYNGKRKGMLSRYEHGLNLIRLLWKDTTVCLYRDWTHYQTGEKVRIWNHYFLRAFKALCKGKRTALTGCGSSGKTFAVAVYVLLMFMCDPENTSVMISTTAGSDAERRVWGEIKSLHSELAEVYPVGTLIDYLHAITFDPGKELENRRDVKERDLRNGIVLIPIPQGSEGEKALGKVVGTKQKTGIVIWVIDELPHMMDNVLRPESNLAQNYRSQVIGIGNANRKTDPHGLMCEPLEGWKKGTVTIDTDHWIGKAGTEVLFFHGERSPNYHPAVDPDTTEKELLPFFYLSNRISVGYIAELNGSNEESPDLGRNTIDFWRFAIGFWYGDDISVTILSPELIRETKSDETVVLWGGEKVKNLCGFDPGFSQGGDENEAVFFKLGLDVKGNQILWCEKESVILRATAIDRADFRKQIAAALKEECDKRGVEPDGIAMDINADGGLMLQEVQKAFNSHAIIALSSLEPPDDDKRYYHRVTQYWFQTREAALTGRMKGFSTTSRYADDLFTRKYESVGKGVVRVEKKEKFKETKKRSPNAGDAFTYGVECARRHGFVIKQASQDPSSGPKSERRPDDLDPYWRRKRRGQSTEPFETVENDVVLSSDYDDGWTQE